MKRIMCALAAATAIVIMGAGCSLFESDSSGTVSTSTSAVESAITAAATAAANVLASDGTQALAVAAAEAIVASQVDDANQQTAINQIIEAEVPVIADSLAAALSGSTATTTASTAATAADAKGKMKARVAFVKSTFVQSAAFKSIIADCMKKYQAASKK